MIKLATIFFFVSIVTGGIAETHAASSVSLGATVIPRESSDTSNDFNYKNLGRDDVTTDRNGKVLGASTEAVDNSTNDASKVGLFTLMLASILVLAKRNKRKKITVNRFLSPQHSDLNISDPAQNNI